MSKDITQNTDYNWSQIARFRDFITHQYFKADEEIIWDLVQNELHLLQQEVEKAKQD